MFIKKYGDFISGIFLLIVTGFYASQIGGIKIINSGSVDAAFIPKLVAGFMFFLSVCLIITSVCKLKAQQPETECSDDTKTAEKIRWIPAVMTAVLLILYVAFFERIGFLITTALYLFAQFMVLAPERTIKRTIQFAVASAVSAYLLQYIFVHLLYVMLPEGLLR